MTGSFVTMDERLSTGDDIEQLSWFLGNESVRCLSTSIGEDNALSMVITDRPCGEESFGTFSTVICSSRATVDGPLVDRTGPVDAPGVEDISCSEPQSPVTR